MITFEILVLFNCNHARWVDKDTALIAKRDSSDIFCPKCNEMQPVKRNLKKRQVVV